MFTASELLEATESETNNTGLNFPRRNAQNKLEIVLVLIGVQAL